jgi:hypothetical protein
LLQEHRAYSQLCVDLSEMQYFPPLSRYAVVGGEFNRSDKGKEREGEGSSTGVSRESVEGRAQQE